MPGWVLCIGLEFACIAGVYPGQLWPAGPGCLRLAESRTPGGARRLRSVQVDRLAHQFIETAKEVIDFLRAGLGGDQILHVLAERFRKFAVDEDFAPSRLV